MYNNIRVECVRLGISIEQMCNDLNISRKSYYNWQNKGNIPASKLIAMANYFECSVDYLLGQTEQRTSASLCISPTSV